jgi:hypothetical protein
MRLVQGQSGWWYAIVDFTRERMVRLAASKLYVGLFVGEPLRSTATGSRSPAWR